MTWSVPFSNSFLFLVARGVRRSAIVVRYIEISSIVIFFVPIDISAIIGGVCVVINVGAIIDIIAKFPSINLLYH